MCRRKTSSGTLHTFMILIKTAGKQLAAMTSIMALLIFISLNACANYAAQSISEAKNISKPHGNFTEGPHIFYKKGKVFVKNIHFTANGIEVNEEAFNSKQELPILTCTVDNKEGTSFDISITGDYPAPPTVYPQPERLFAISDIEGNFDAFEKTLKGNKVIDQQLNWSYGDGHLVLVGDFFDRGYNVTPVLWLIYKLEQQAKKAGGMVHFIVGNHEEMNMRGDVRYVKDRYLKAAKAMKISYQGLYSENTELGRWLRSKNVTLDLYGAKYVVVGHTIVPKVSSLHNGRVIAIDVKHDVATSEKITNSLLFEGKNMYATNVDGQKSSIEVFMTEDVIVGVFDAVKKGNVAGVASFLKSGDADKRINKYYFSKRITLLQTAIKYNQKDVVAFLLKEGADINMLSENKTPLMHAIERNNKDITMLLIMNGANTNALNKQNKSPLFYCAKYGNVEITKVLLQNGAKVNIKDRKGRTAVEYALKNDNKKVAVFIENYKQ